MPMQQSVDCLVLRERAGANGFGVPGLQAILEGFIHSVQSTCIHGQIGPPD